MSKEKRSPYDFYPTPADAISKMIEEVFGNKDIDISIFEPCAGDGAIVWELRKNLPSATIVANEIDNSHQDQLAASGATKITFNDVLTIDRFDTDFVITNPPFSIAQEVLEHIFENKGKNTRVIMLLRLNFLGSQKRHEFWKKYPPNKIMVLSKRPSFTGNGTDSQEYAWFVWDDNIYKNPIVVL